MSATVEMPKRVSDDVDESDLEKASQDTLTPRLGQDEVQYPQGIAVVIIMLSVWLALFLVALVGLAYPRLNFRSFCQDIRN